MPAARPSLPSGAPKAALFIDGAHLHATAKALGIEIDYKKLLAEFARDKQLLRACYYATMAEDEFGGIRPLVDWLSYNGYLVVTKPVKGFVKRPPMIAEELRRQADAFVDLAELRTRILAGARAAQFRNILHFLPLRGTLFKEWTGHVLLRDRVVGGDRPIVRRAP